MWVQSFTEHAGSGRHAGSCANQQRHVPPKGLDRLVVGVFQCAEPVHDVGCLAYHQPEIGQVERDVFEVQQRTRLNLVARGDVGVQVERRQRDPRLHASLHLQEFEVHVDRISQLGLAFSERAELDGFACVRPAWTRWASGGIGHQADHTGLRVQVPGLSAEAPIR